MTLDERWKQLVHLFPAKAKRPPDPEAVFLELDSVWDLPGGSARLVRELEEREGLMAKPRFQNALMQWLDSPQRRGLGSEDMNRFRNTALDAVRERNGTSAGLWQAITAGLQRKEPWAANQAYKQLRKAFTATKGFLTDFEGWRGLSRPERSAFLEASRTVLATSEHAERFHREWDLLQLPDTGLTPALSLTVLPSSAPSSDLPATDSVPGEANPAVAKPAAEPKPKVDWQAEFRRMQGQLEHLAELPGRMKKLEMWFEELDRLKAERQDLQQDLARQQRRADGLEQELAEARENLRQAEADRERHQQAAAAAVERADRAERRAAQDVHSAGQDRDHALKTFQAELWSALRSEFVGVTEVPPPNETFSDPAQEVLIHTLRAIRGILKAKGIPPY